MSWLRGSQAKLSTRISHDLVKEHRIWCFLLDILQWDSVLLMLTNSSKDSCSRGLEYTTLSQKVCIACQKMRILPLGNVAIGCLGSKFLFLFFLMLLTFNLFEICSLRTHLPPTQPSLSTLPNPLLVNSVTLTLCILLLNVGTFVFSLYVCMTLWSFAL